MMIQDPRLSLLRHWRRPALAALAVLLALAVVGCSMSGAPAASSSAASQIDTSRTRPSDAGLFRATITPSADPAPINEMHTWTLHVETPDGKPVENAQVSVDGGMPEHGHGLPTQPKVTKYLGNGDYLVEGMRFNMPGMWQLKFRVTAGGQTDQVVFNLALRG